MLLLSYAMAFLPVIFTFQGTTSPDFLSVPEFFLFHKIFLQGGTDFCFPTVFIIVIDRNEKPITDIKTER